MWNARHWAAGRYRWGHGACALASVIAVLLCARAGHAAAPEGTRVRVELLTVSAGDAFLSRAGHAALSVVEIWPDGRELSTVYNYGDADFDDPWLPLRFLFGRPNFRLAISGDFFDTVQRYGPLQNRDVYVQQIALSSAQAEALGAQLAVDAQPENREYPYHYLERTCTTELRNLLDTALDGALSRQLAQPDPWTVRAYQRLTFDGTFVVAIVGDIVFGRAHDQPISQYFAMMWPARMREYLQAVRVPDPAGGPASVPLASPPVLVAERGGRPATVAPNRVSRWFFPLAAALVLLGAFALRRTGRLPSRLAGAWLLAWSVPSAVLGFVVAVFCLASTVPELRNNELIASLLVTDVALWWPGVAWVRGKGAVPRWVRGYARFRLAVVAAAVAAHAVGLFVQQPVVIPIASLGASVALWWLVRPVVDHDRHAAGAVVDR